MERCDGELELPELPALLTYPDRHGAFASWRALLSKLRLRGYETVLIQIPLSSVWSSLTDPVAVDGRLDEKLEALRGENPGLRILPLPEFSDPLKFNDWTHLSYCGAVRYTDHLSRRLRLIGSD